MVAIIWERDLSEFPVPERDGLVRRRPFWKRAYGSESISYIYSITNNILGFPEEATFKFLSLIVLYSK
jgi:hypothetical protein